MARERFELNDITDFNKLKEKIGTLVKEGKKLESILQKINFTPGDLSLRATHKSLCEVAHCVQQIRHVEKILTRIAELFNDLIAYKTRTLQETKVAF